MDSNATVLPDGTIVMDNGQVIPAEQLEVGKKRVLVTQQMLDATRGEGGTAVMEQEYERMGTSFEDLRAGRYPAQRGQRGQRGRGGKRLGGDHITIEVTATAAGAQPFNANVRSEFHPEYVVASGLADTVLDRVEYNGANIWSSEGGIPISHLPPDGQLGGAALDGRVWETNGRLSGSITFPGPGTVYLTFFGSSDHNATGGNC